MSSDPASEAATLELRAARFREGAEALSESLTLRSEARAVGLIGEWGALFRALTGPAIEGDARVCGVELRAALARGVAGFAPCDPELPPSFTVREYLEHSARLVDGSRARATTETARALDDFALAGIAAKKTSEIALQDRRALVLAAAALNAPAVCLLEAPLRGLDAAGQDRLVRACVKIAERSRVIVSCEPPTTPSSARTLLDGCGELFQLERGELVAQGTPAQVLASGARHHVTFAGARSEALEAALEAASIALTLRDEGAVNGNPATRYLVTLPHDANAEILLETASNAGAVVLELQPLQTAGLLETPRRQA